MPDKNLLTVIWLVNNGNNTHLWVFQKAEIAFAEAARAPGSYNFSFLKNSHVQINSKLNSKPYDYLY